MLKSCLSAVERDQRCGEATVDPNCEHYAQVESKDAIIAYEHIADTACGTVPELAVSETSMGNRICGKVESSCGVELDAEYCRTLNEATGWMRADVVNAVEVCFHQSSCADLVSCVDLWASAIWIE